MLADVKVNHGVIPGRALRATGVTARQLADAVDAGALTRIRRGWYARPDASADVVAAVRCGGRLSCVSALRLVGVWTIDDRRIHVRVARGVDVVRRGAKVHWTNDRRTDDPVDSVEASLEAAIGCVDRASAIVALDSAINGRHVSRVSAEALCMKTPRGRSLVSQIDGRAESGIETLARLRLRSRRIMVRPQVTIRGIGRVDLLIGDRLVLELDGRAWHDRPGDFERDRSRDRTLVTAGYLVFRASYTQVMEEWGSLEKQILTVVGRREHMWARNR